MRKLPHEKIEKHVAAPCSNALWAIIGLLAVFFITSSAVEKLPVPVPTQANYPIY